MARVRTKHTEIEMKVRRLVHGMGYRFRLHAAGLPGTPDLIFRSRKKVIFVHGCFWHHHAGCRKGSLPKTRRSFWSAKLSKNVSRDLRILAEIEALGWQPLVVWECELADVDQLARKLRRFLNLPVSSQR